MKKFYGFTLVEMLVVFGVFLIISTIILGILFTVLRGSNKSDSVIMVKQNGEYAMNQMVSSMRYAKSLDSPTQAACTNSGINVSSIQVTTLDMVKTTISCPATFTYPTFIDINGVKLTNTNTVVVETCHFSCTQVNSGNPIIGIYFSLFKVNSNGLPEGGAKIPFESSVALRNIGG